MRNLNYLNCSKFNTRENMAVHVNITKPTICKEKTSALHYMPCVIKHNGPANVSTYLEPNISKGQDGIFTASFRGRPIWGKEIKLPKNYQGVVLQEARERFNENAERNVYMAATFDGFTYWNYDQVPSSNDEIFSIMDWIDIVSAKMALKLSSRIHLEFPS